VKTVQSKPKYDPLIVTESTRLQVIGAAIKIELSIVTMLLEPNDWIPPPGVGRDAVPWLSIPNTHPLNIVHMLSVAVGVNFKEG